MATMKSASCAKRLDDRESMVNDYFYKSQTGSEMNELYQSGSKSIPGYGPLIRLESSDVFAPGRPALVVSAQSGEGKTVTAVDMIYTSRNIATGLCYVTNSYTTPANAYLRAMVPEIHVKNWDINLLCRLWGDILQRSLALNRSIDDRFIEQFLQVRCPNSQSLSAELQAIDEIVQTNAQFFPDVPSGKAAIAAHKKLAKLAFIRNNFRSDDKNLTEQERAVVRASRSSSPCFILICDDVTAQLRNPPKEDVEVPSIAEGEVLETRTLKGKDGLSFLLINLLTLARHFAIVGFFVHTFDAFDATVRGQFGGMLFLGEDSIVQACRERTLQEGDKDLIREAWTIAKEYKHHKVILYTNPELTNHKQRVALIRPAYHAQPQPIGVPSYQAVMRNISMAIDQYRGSESHRALVQAQKQRLEDESETLARIGRGEPVPQQQQQQQQQPMMLNTFSSPSQIQVVLPPSTDKKQGLDDLLG